MKINRYIVVKENSTVIVWIMPCKADNKYHFVNLTKGHICSCGFETVEDAVADMERMRKLGKVKSYIKV